MMPFSLFNTRPQTFEEIVGSSCEGCDHSFTGDDIRAALKAAVRALPKGRSGEFESL